MLPFRRTNACLVNADLRFVLLVLFLKCGDDFLDFLRPLNLSAAVVAVFSLKKNLTFAVFAEESMLLRFFVLGGLHSMSSL